MVGEGQVVDELRRRLREAEHRIDALVARENLLVTDQDLQRHLARTELLYEASQTFAEQVADPAALLQSVARMCSKLVGDFGAVTLISDSGEWLEQLAAYHPDPEIDREYRAFSSATRVRPGEGVMGRVLKNDRAELMPTVDPETIVALAPETFRNVARRLNVCSFVGVPMHARGRVIGGISMARSRPGAPYSMSDLASLQDLADRAALAYENARLYAGLERRVAEATEQLVTSNEELRAFSYSVAHDLRAPLRSIGGFSQIILEDNATQLDESGRNAFARIRAAVTRMDALIDGLLKLAQSSQVELRRESVNVSDLAWVIVARMKEREPSRAVVAEVQPGIVVHADAVLVEALLVNLLANAWKFTSRKQSAHIEVSATAGVIRVHDNGAGFDPTHIDRLFRVFQRLHPAGEFDGTGIGLATVLRIVKRHGGKIWAESEVGEGATFYFTLGPTG